MFLHGRVFGLTGLWIVGVALLSCAPDAGGRQAEAFEAPVKGALALKDRQIPAGAKYEVTAGELDENEFSEVVAFLGPIRGAYFHQRPGLVSDQLAAVLSGPRGPRDVMADGGYVEWGCLPRSCPERGAVLYSATGNVEAVGLIHGVCFDCGDRRSRLTIFRRQPVGVGKVDPLQHWLERLSPEYSSTSLPIIFAPTQTVLLQ